MEQEFLTIDEAANILDVHPKTIRRYINSGKISAQKVAGSWRIYQDSINEYLGSCGVHHHQNDVSKDDFCIFMDSDYFNSEDTIQICTIVDYFVQDDQVKQLLKDVMDIVADYSMDKKKSRFNYVYDDTDNKMRLVFWGAPTYMEKIVSALKPYE